MKKGIWAGIVALLLAGASQSATTVTDSGSTVETITSLDQIERIVRDTQRQFWQVVPPSTDDPFYLHPERIIRIVDWEGWPKRVLKQMYAEMGTVGAAGSMYAFHRIFVMEDRSGAVIFYNMYDQEVWRIPAPKNHNPYLFAFLAYGVESVDALSDQQKLFGRSSNVGVEILLLDKSFASLYEKDAATDSSAMRLATEPVGTMESSLMMTTYSFPEFPGGGGSSTNGGGSVTTNPIVTLKFQVPTNFGHYAEIFAKENLNTRLWQVAENRMAVTAGTELVWTDLTSSNVPVRFYLLSNPEIDTDLDGYSDGRERYVTDTPTNSFNFFDSDFDGMHDWFETMYFGNLDRDGSEDFDGDGLANAEEMVLTATNVVRGSRCRENREGHMEHQDRHSAKTREASDQVCRRFRQIVPRRSAGLRQLLQRRCVRGRLGPPCQPTARKPLDFGNHSVGGIEGSLPRCSPPRRRSRA